MNTKSRSPLRIRRGAIATASAALLLGTSACGLGDSGADKTAASAPAKATSASPAGNNGVADKSADEILKAAIDAFSAAKSVHVKGTVTDAGDKIALDLYLTHNGGRGTIEGPISGKRVPVSVISTNGRFYLKSRELWRVTGGAEVANVIGNRWVLVPKKEAKSFAAFEQMVSIDSFAKEVLKADEPITKGAQTVVDGRPAIGLKGSDGTLHVATTDSPYPLKIVPLEPKTQDEGLAFLGYNAPVNLAPPADPIDPSKLGG